MEDINYQWYIQETDSDGYKWFDELEGETDLSLKTEPITKEQVYRLQVEDYYGDRRNVVFNVFPQAVSGWVEEGGERYYYKDDGTKLTNGWAKDGSAWYWMDSSGKITKNQWVQSGGKWYYMNANGVMVTGWQQIGGKWYYFNANGDMKTGWLQLGSKWYYLKSSGEMATGKLEIGGKMSEFDGNGVWKGYVS
jgi:glucan-binding YG repeat protein